MQGVNRGELWGVGEYMETLYFLYKFSVILKLF